MTPFAWDPAWNEFVSASVRHADVFAARCEAIVQASKGRKPRFRKRAFVRVVAELHRSTRRRKSDHNIWARTATSKQIARRMCDALGSAG